jgi:hypothetical protein
MDIRKSTDKMRRGHAAIYVPAHIVAAAVDVAECFVRLAQFHRSS